MAAPIETKVTASTAAAAVSGLALYALGRWVFKGSVPDVVASWVYVLIPAAFAFGAGYLAKHTNRYATGGIIAPPPEKTLMPPPGGHP